jgi:hypothetical protein
MCMWKAMTCHCLRIEKRQATYVRRKSADRSINRQMRGVCQGLEKIQQRVMTAPSKMGGHDRAESKGC